MSCTQKALEEIKDLPDRWRALGCRQRSPGTEDDSNKWPIRDHDPKKLKIKHLFLAKLPEDTTIQFTFISRTLIFCIQNTRTTNMTKFERSRKEKHFTFFNK